MAADSTSLYPPVRRVEKPWGYEVWFAVTERYAGKIIHIGAGHELSLQFHRQKDESIYVVAGAMELELEDAAGELQTHQLRPGDCQHIPVGRRHRMRALVDTDICGARAAEPDRSVPPPAPRRE